jgi:glucokinase
VDADGRVLARSESRTEAERGSAVVLNSVKRIIRGLAGEAGPGRPIGIACAGQVHPETQSVVYAPNLFWHDVPIRAVIAEEFGAPVWVDNDVRAAAWGEYRFGAAKDARSVVAVFVGTGVGSGAVLGGTLWRGSGNAAGEIGHTEVVPGGVPCVCGQHGCLEAYASGIGLQRRFASGREAGAATRLEELTGGDPMRLTAAIVDEAARTGDPLARTLWEDLDRYLTMALANYVTLLNPDVLVLGGGVIESVPALFETVARGARARTTAMGRSVLRVTRAALGDWSGAIGAADLARGTI